jgi:6-phosphogluconolactonase
VINELDSTITAFRYEPQQGKLESIQTVSTLPPDFDGVSYTAEVAVHPGGKFVYGSNRGHDSIAVFRVDPESGQLSLLQVEPTQGKTPRNFAVDPTGRYLLAENQDSDSIVVFRIEPDDGRLVATGHALEVPKPVCIKFAVN